MKFVLRRCAVAVIGWACLASRASAIELPENTAKGTFLPKGGVPIALAHAVAFVDKTDRRHPTILILSDKKLPAENWTSEFDLMRAHPEFNGVLFWIDPDGRVFRTDISAAGAQSSVSGYFELKLTGPMGEVLAGSAKSSEPVGDGPRLDATFRATLE